MTGRSDTLQEIDGVRQIPDAEGRRWFVSRDLDLLVWYSGDDEIYGFQLCCGEGESEDALTWMVDRGFLLSRVDDGEGGGAGKPKKSPMLVAGGNTDVSELAAKFEAQCRDLPVEIAALVMTRIGEFGAGAAE